MTATGPARRRPEVWANCAASADGRIAFADGVRARLSSPEDLRRVHAIRAGVDAILVGVGTVVHDDPSLRVRAELVDRPPAAPPLRVIVDGSGRTPAGARVLDGTAPTVVGTTEANRRTYPAHVRTIVTGGSRVDLAVLFERLAEQGVHRLLVEGGAEILRSVLVGRWFDRFTIYYAPVLIGDGSAPPVVGGPAARSFADATALELERVERLGAGYLATYRPGPSGHTADAVEPRS